MVDAADVAAATGAAVVSALSAVAVTLLVVVAALRPGLARALVRAFWSISATGHACAPGDVPDAPPTRRVPPLRSVETAQEGGTRPVPRCGPYELTRLIHQSPTIQLWHALDTRDGTAVAFKRLLPRGEAGDVARAGERLEREGIALDAAASPHVVALHDSGVLDGAPFVAMQLAAGGSLLETLAAHPDGMPAAQVARIVAQVADGLAAAHRAGWVHRDVKASNVVYDPASALWQLCDFGIAQPIGEPGVDRLTAPGFVVGTPGHLAPELFIDTVDGAATPASDVYALAVLPYQLLTGRLPFHAHRDDRPTCPRHRSRAVPTVSPNGRPGALDGVLARALEIDPIRRYPGPVAFAHTFARVLTAHTRDTSRPAAERPPGSPGDASAARPAHDRADGRGVHHLNAA